MGAVITLTGDEEERGAAFPVVFVGEVDEKWPVPPVIAPGPWGHSVESVDCFGRWLLWCWGLGVVSAPSTGMVY